MNGAELKDAGQEAALRNEREEWLEVAMNALSNWSVTKPHFYIEDFREWFYSAGGREPHSPNVWGAMTKRMKSLGYRMTGKFKTATRKQAHARLIFEWSRP